jgi:hypothetical protein
MRNFLQMATDALEDFLAPAEEPNEPVGQKPTPIQRKVLKIVHDPRVPSEGNRKLSDVLGWNNHEQLAYGYINDVRRVSYGYANYQIVDRIEVDGLPVKEDGFSYTPDAFVKLWRTRKGFHKPDAVDYMRLVNEFNIIERVNSGEIDEIWLFGFPYAGYYEPIMGGPGAFWCNAPALKGTEHAKRRFVIMGFSYERGVGEMLENLGHRSESIMKHVYRKLKGPANLWERFARYDQTHPGKAEVGVMHFAPNSERDYDWGNKRKVKSCCDNWLKFPNLSGPARIVDCSDWGDGDIRTHHKWWYKRIPHITGNKNGISYNWWKYIIDPNNVR